MRVVPQQLVLLLKQIETQVLVVVERALRAPTAVPDLIPLVALVVLASLLLSMVLRPIVLVVAAGLLMAVLVALVVTAVVALGDLVALVLQEPQTLVVAVVVLITVLLLATAAQA
jgi:hypothetical protein